MTTRASALSALLGVLVTAAPGQASAALQGRELDGNASNGFEAFYDTTLDITWLADANYFATAINGRTSIAERLAFVNGIMATTPVVAGHTLVIQDFLLNGDGTSSGALRWWGAAALASSSTLYGVSGWRLPTMLDVGNDGCNFSFTGSDCGWRSFSSGELAHMYYVNLGRPSGRGPSGENWPAYGIPNQVALPVPGVDGGVIRNLRSDSYWYGVSYAPDGSYAWSFYNTGGEQSAELKNGQFAINRAWLVHDGDIAPVPEPSTTALLLLGLLGLGVWRRQVELI